MATAQPRLPDYLPDPRELAVLLAARGLACALAWQSGFRALSDDDYARISIAQRFAHAPSLDPSGTSWLPAPFWLYGAVFRCFGGGLGVARATAIALSLAATVLVYIAARLLGVSRLGAILAAALSSLLVPYSTVLGLAAVPEVPCAALLLFSAATLTRSEPALRALGGVSLAVACLSRYEAWPIALVFSGFCLWDAVQMRRPALLGGAVLALAGPALWLLHGRAEHGDPLFFVARVTAYRRALGASQASTLRRLAEYPWALVSNAPALCGLLLGLAFQKKPGLATRERLQLTRCSLVLLAMLAFLMLGSVRDGVPTHHAARVLLPIWFFGCVVVGHGLARRSGSPVHPAWWLAIGAMLMAASLLAPGLSTAGLSGADFADRALEIEAGRAARQHTSDALAIDTPDYGYFAVQAAFGSPLGTSVLDDHDPRRPAVGPFGSAEALDRALRQRNVRFVIVTTEHAALLHPRCARQWSNERYALYACAEPRLNR